MTRELATANYDRAPAWIRELTIWANQARTANEERGWRKLAAKVTADMIGWASI